MPWLCLLDTFVQNVICLSHAVKPIRPLKWPFGRGALRLSYDIIDNLELPTAVPDNKIAFLLKTVGKVPPVSWYGMFSHPVLNVAFQFLDVMF